ncbi:MAG: hypothetical protein N2C14_01975, partial [Planctomycetales bacterium]
FGRLEREDDRWRGETSLPVLARWDVRFYIWPDMWDENDEDGVPKPDRTEVGIEIWDEQGDGPSSAQEVAFQQVVRRQDALARDVLSFLHDHATDGIEDALECIDSDEERDQFDQLIERHKLDQLEGVEKQLYLHRIGFIEQEKDGQSYLSFDFFCGWDDEHGVSLLVHDAKIIGSAVEGDFYNRRDVEGHAM